MEACHGYFFDNTVHGNFLLRYMVLLETHLLFLQPHLVHASSFMHFKSHALVLLVTQLSELLPFSEPHHLFREPKDMIKVIMGVCTLLQNVKSVPENEYIYL